MYFGCRAITTTPWFSARGLDSHVGTDGCPLMALVECSGRQIADGRSQRRFCCEHRSHWRGLAPCSADLDKSSCRPQHWGFAREDDALTNPEQ